MINTINDSSILQFVLNGLTTCRYCRNKLIVFECPEKINSHGRV